MDAKQIQSLQPKLNRFLGDFAGCFPPVGTSSHLQTYVAGQLSDLPRKSIEPIALKAGIPPRTLQQFLSHLSWDHATMRDIVERRVAERHQCPHSVGVFDETSCPKKGIHSPGVQRQWCGATGKKDNCQVSVHLSYAADDFHTMLDGELFLPDSWSEDRDRCRKCGIPDDLVYRPKWQIALELYDKAVKNGVIFEWITFDEGYGCRPLFLEGLDERHQKFVGEVPCSLFGWVNEPPAVTERRYRKGTRGGRTRGKRLVSGHHKARSVKSHLKFSPSLRNQPWKPWLVKQGEKGPMVWEIKHVAFFSRDSRGLPGKRQNLIVARNPMKGDEIKYFVSNAPEGTPLEVMLLVGFTRWTVERCFEDEKMELGFDHFEGRTYLGFKRHQTICSVTHLFLAETQQELRKKKSGRNALPAEDCACRTRTIVVVVPRVGQETDSPSRQGNSVPSTAQCSGEAEPHQANNGEAPRARYSPQRATAL